MSKDPEFPDPNFFVDSDNVTNYQFHIPDRRVSAMVTDEGKVTIDWDVVKEQANQPGYMDYSKGIALILLEARKHGALFGDIPNGQ